MKARILLLVMLLTSLTCADEINVYFAGGQSNAKRTWADAIEAELLKADPNAVVVWIQHGGTAIREWYSSYLWNGVVGRQPYYLTDFYNPDPAAEGLLETEFNSITAAGNTPVMKGLLWFQGEKDHQLAETRDGDRYYNCFIGLRNQIRDDFLAPYMPSSIAAVWKDNPEVEAYFELIRDQQFSLGLLDSIITYDSKGLNRPDTVHLDEPSQILAGTIMAQNLISIPEPSTVALLFFTVGIFLLRHCKMRKAVAPPIKAPSTIDFLHSEKFNRPLTCTQTQSWEFES